MEQKKYKKFTNKENKLKLGINISLLLMTITFIFMQTQSLPIINFIYGLKIHK